MPVPEKLPVDQLGTFRIVHYVPKPEIGPEELFISVEGEIRLPVLLQLIQETFPEIHLSDLVIKPGKGQACIIKENK